MKFNLHTHTTRCHHAQGSDEEFVLSAIKNGYDMIGFADHAPYVFPKDYHSGFRMELEKTQEYVDSVRSLQKKYEGQIEIKLGFETEYYPKLFDEEIEYLKSFDYDYLLLAQHFTDNEYEPKAKYSGAQTNSLITLDKYINQLVEGAQTGLFTYVCHPDLINFTGNRNIYLNKMRDMIIKLKECNIPLEFNFLGYCDNRQYPADDFWAMVKEIGNDVVIGLDAHTPDSYDDIAHLEEMKNKIKTLGLDYINEIELVK
jgi:histidinol-phosphatase (PHP family)